MYTINGKESTFVPKKVSLSFTFNVLHTHLTGWQKDPDPAFGGFLSRQFPNAVYVVQDQKTVLTSDGEVTAEIDQEAANQALVLGGE